MQVAALYMHQNLTNFKLGQPSVKISAKSVRNFLCNPADKPTDKYM